MKKIIIALFTVFTTIFLAGAAHAEGPSPVGLWRSYDLDGIARSLVQFSIVNGKLQGRIVKTLNPAKGQQPNELCSNCPAPWTNKKKVGLTIIWGLKQQGNEWVDGRVLDTDSGGVYRCQVSVSPDNRTLHLHAYVAVPMLGRTVDWVRVK